MRTTFVCNSFHNPYVLRDCLATLRAYCPAPAIAVCHAADVGERRFIDAVGRHTDTMILHVDDIHPPKGFNMAIEYVNTEYVGLFNDDVMFIPHSPVWDVLEDAMTPDVSMAGCATNFSATAENILHTEVPDTSDVPFLTAGGQFMRTEDYRTLGGYDEQFDALGGYWDIDLCLRVPGRIVLDKRAYYHHHGSQTIVQTPNRVLRGETAVNNLVRKHGVAACEPFLNHVHFNPTIANLKEAVS